MSRVHLVLQAYGLEEVHVEALYAAWSALAWRGDVPLDVHVCTDDAARYAALAGRLETRVLAAAEIREWRGPCDFTHRFKAIMIREMARRFPGDRLLYLDADVFFVAPVARVTDRIGPGRAVLHEREYNVATHTTAQMRKFRRHLGRMTFRGRPIDLAGDMWNAGAVGMDPAEFVVIDEWIEFIDTIYPRYRRGLVEQYSIGLLLQRRAEVSPCAAEVFHYWARKDDYVAALRGELETLRALPLEESFAHLRAHRVALPPAPPPRRTLGERVRRALAKLRR